MALLKSIPGFEGTTILAGGGVYLRHPTMADFETWADLRERSRAFLTPWEPVWPKDDLTRSAFRRRLRRYERDLKDDLAYPFFVFDGATDQLVGGLTLSGVRRGVTQSCSVGYWVAEPFKRRGYTRSALRTVIPYVFNELLLHRLEAACLPHNTASRALLTQLGFNEEGYAKEYLKINGTWQDHVLYALLEQEAAHI